MKATGILVAMACVAMITHGCLRHSSDTEDAPIDQVSEDPAIDAEMDAPPVDALQEVSDPTDEEETPDPCAQELPYGALHADEMCSAEYPDSCLDTGCGSCQVCFIDYYCNAFDSLSDAPTCYCAGDGLCHDLCASDEDCEGEEHCVMSQWSDDGGDSIGAPLWVCLTGSHPHPPWD
jgi:hypothetical protein